MQLTSLKRNKTIFGYMFVYFIKLSQFFFIEFKKFGELLYLQYEVTKSRIFFLKWSKYTRNIKLPMCYLHPLNKLKVYFKSEAHKNKTKTNIPESFLSLL